MKPGIHLLQSPQLKFFDYTLPLTPTTFSSLVSLPLLRIPHADHALHRSLFRLRPLIFAARHPPALYNRFERSQCSTYLLALMNLAFPPCLLHPSQTPPYSADLRPHQGPARSIITPHPLPAQSPDTRSTLLSGNSP